MRTLMVPESFSRDGKAVVAGTQQRMRMSIDATESLGELDLRSAIPLEFALLRFAGTVDGQSRRMSDLWVSPTG